MTKRGAAAACAAASGGDDARMAIERSAAQQGGVNGDRLGATAAGTAATALG